MKYIGIRPLIAFMLLFVLSVCGCDRKTVDHASRGLLDLSSWDFERDGIAYLDGEWEFYWEQLLTPDDFNRGELPQMTGYFAIPGYWNGYRFEGRSLSGDGYATFRLRIRIRSDLKTLAMRIEEESTAYRLWVNGSLAMANGVTGADADTMKPYKKISTAVLPVESGYLDCVLQVSNFYMVNGGPYRKIALGTPDAINKRHTDLLAMDLLLFGILSIIAFHHIILYFLRRKDPSSLYFGCFCLLWCLGIPFGGSGGKFITLFFSDVPWYWMSRMELLTWFPVVPLILMFFKSLYPNEFAREFTRFVLIFASVFILYIFFVPSRLISYTEVPYQIFSLILFGYSLVMLFSAMMHKQNSAVPMFIGFIILLMTVINDILYMNMIIYSIYLASFGFAVMILFQSFVLSRRFAQSFAAVETLSSELEEKNIALSKLDKLKDEFLANTSHELRTPLNGIIGIAESLISGVTGRLPAKTRENLSMIVSSGKRLAGLINDILDFSRLKNRDIRLHRQSVDIKALTDTVLIIMKSLASGKGLGLRNEIPDEMPTVWGDENRLQQILYNLIGNAVKFTDKGEVRVSAVQKDDMAEISVTDTGIGIPENKHAEIFQPFEQADASDSRTHGGVGLGLSITRQLVELHGGVITLRSFPDAGSVFSFTIPLSAGTSLDHVRPAKTEEGAPSAEPIVSTETFESREDLPGFEEKITILVVDDDPVNLQVVTNHLTFKNVTVITAPGGMQAVKLIEGGLMPDLVLLDIMMPRMTGYDVSVWLRQRYSSSELPVIMLTAKNGADDIVEGFSRGANDYLVKPFNRDELLARVVSQLKLKESYLTLRENMALRKELEERRQVERELRLMQRRLTLMLDSVDEAILAVNEAEEITFINRVCEEMLGYRAEDLLGRPFTLMLRQDQETGTQDDKKEAIGRCINGEVVRDLGVMTFTRADGGICGADVYLSRFNVEEDIICLLILRRKASGQPEHGEGKVEQSIAVIDAINRNRSRLQNIKMSLNGLLPWINEQHPEFLSELGAIDEALDNTVRSMLIDEGYQSRRHIAVEVMTCALEYWTESTGHTKAELAHHSRLWKVYTNRDGWERTQTLDKYLNIDTLPQKPQWFNIYKTAEFVLANVKKSSALRTRLEVLLTRLRVSK